MGRDNRGAGKGPTCLRSFGRDFVGVSANSVPATGRQLEGVGGEGPQVFQKVGGGGLEANTFLQEQKEDISVQRLVDTMTFSITVISWESY